MANILVNLDGAFISDVIAASSDEKETDTKSIVIKDPKLKSELVVSGLEFPTSMAFLDQNDFLILEKETGLVKRVTDGKILEPLLKLNVSGKDERGLLGIDVDKKEYTGFNVVYVYLSYVECETKESCENKVVRYELDNENNKLVFPKELVSVKSFPDDSHVGGVVRVGPDDNVYVTVGDFSCTECAPFETQAQNFANGVPADGRAAILRVSPDGDPVDNGILGKEYPLNLYYAYGVRNSFGIDFDPLTGNLWDTENGPHYGDEINLVEPGFNSGALSIFGNSNTNSNSESDKDVQSDKESSSDAATPASLVTFNGAGKYSEPELSWQKTVAPTALLFLDSNKLGTYYQNDMFVANAGEGKIYHFDLSDDRKSLALKGPLADKVVDPETEADSVTFAEGFGLVTDLEVNPYDGYLYVVVPVKDSTGGAVYKIVPKSPDSINVPTSPDKINVPPSLSDANGPTSPSLPPSNTIQFPAGIESTQEGVPVPIEEDNSTNIGNNNNSNNNTNINDNGLPKCSELKSFDKMLMAEWQQGKVTDKQAMSLGKQLKDLMIQEGCIK